MPRKTSQLLKEIVTMGTFALKDLRDQSLMIRSLDLFVLLVGIVLKAPLKFNHAPTDTSMCLQEVKA